MTKRVLALLHIWDDPMGLLEEVLEAYAISYDALNVDREPIPDPAKYDAIIIFGGPQHVYDFELYPYFAPEIAMLQRAIKLDIPLLGICLGGQLLAHALGARVRRHSITEIGFFDVPFTSVGTDDPLYANLPGYQKVFHWHEDTFDLPHGAVLLATNESTVNQAFRYGRSTYALQYHVELTPSMLDTWLHLPQLKQELIDTLGLDAYNTLEQEQTQHYPLYREHSRVLFENFLRLSKLF